MRASAPEVLLFQSVLWNCFLIRGNPRLDLDLTEERTSAAKAVVVHDIYGTAKAVPFVR